MYRLRCVAVRESHAYQSNLSRSRFIGVLPVRYMSLTSAALIKMQSDTLKFEDLLHGDEELVLGDAGLSPSGQARRTSGP